MTRHILFIQGGAGEKDHAADAKLVASLQNSLGEAYVVHYPLLPEEPTPDFGRKAQIGKVGTRNNGLCLFDGKTFRSFFGTREL